MSAAGVGRDLVGVVRPVGTEERAVDGADLVGGRRANASAASYVEIRLCDMWYCCRTCICAKGAQNTATEPATLNSLPLSAAHARKYRLMED